MLLETRPDSSIAQYYVREMYQTIRCDHLYDVSEMRSAFEDQVKKLFAAIGVVSTTLFALEKHGVLVGIIRAQRKGTAAHYIGASSSASAYHLRIPTTRKKTRHGRNVKGSCQNLSTV